DAEEHGEEKAEGGHDEQDRPTRCEAEDEHAYQRDHNQQGHEHWANLLNQSGLDLGCDGNRSSRHFHAIAIARHHFEDLRSANVLIIAARLHPVPLQCAAAAAFVTVAPLITAVDRTSSRQISDIY